jgi:hypothetical protein
VKNGDRLQNSGMRAAAFIPFVYLKLAKRSFEKPGFESDKLRVRDWLMANSYWPIAISRSLPLFAKPVLSKSWGK